jgi:hypothetical protein
VRARQDSNLQPLDISTHARRLPRTDQRRGFGMSRGEPVRAGVAVTSGRCVPNLHWAGPGPDRLDVRAYATSIDSLGRLLMTPGCALRRRSRVEA